MNMAKTYLDLIENKGGLVQQETMKLKARIKELESAISTTVEDLCLRAERASDSDVAQMLWGIAEDLENEKGLDQNRV